MRDEPTRPPLGTLPVIAAALAAVRGRGRLDTATRDRVSGWAIETDGPVQAAAVQVLANGALIARVLANTYRPDLRAAAIGDGRHGFDVLIPGGLSPLVRQVIEVRRERDGTALENSPITIEAAGRFDPAMEQAVAGAVAGALPGDEQARILAFLADQVGHLLQQAADADGEQTARAAWMQFRHRWGSGPNPDTPHDPGLRALVIDERLPVPGRDAGSQAVLSHIAALQSLGHATSLVAADMAASPELDGRGIRVWGAPHYASVEDVLRRQAGCFDVIYLHRAGIAARYLALARHHHPRARVIYSVADLHHVRLARQAAIEGRPELVPAARGMRLVECTAAWQADAVITHSADEATLLRQIVPGAAVHRIGWEVPIRKTRVAAARRAGLAFIGGFAHAPNLDAAEWLVETVMPLVWQQEPGISCYLVGSEMPDRVRALARPGVEIVGQVENLGRAVFDRVRLTVAPLRYGAGIKGKVLESLAAGVPCVMTPVAAEGLALPAPLDEWVAADAPGLAARVLTLHALPAARHRILVHAGLTYVAEGFSPAAVVAGLRAAIA